MKLLDWIGSFFVYKSPAPKEGFRSLLHTLPTRKLKLLTGTKGNYSKKKYVNLYFKQNNL